MPCILLPFGYVQCVPCRAVRGSSRYGLISAQIAQQGWTRSLSIVVRNRGSQWLPSLALLGSGR